MMNQANMHLAEQGTADTVAVAFSLKISPATCQAMMLENSLSASTINEDCRLGELKQY